MTIELALLDPVHDALYRAARGLMTDGLELGDLGLLERAIECFEKILEGEGELEPEERGTLKLHLTECCMGMARIWGNDASADMPDGSVGLARALALLECTAEPDPITRMDEEAIRQAFVGSRWAQVMVGVFANLELGQAGSPNAYGYYERALRTVRDLLNGSSDLEVTEEQQVLLRLIEARCLRGQLITTLRMVVNIAGTDGREGREAVPILQRLTAFI